MVLWEAAEVAPNVGLLVFDGCELNEAVGAMTSCQQEATRE